MEPYAIQIFLLSAGFFIFNHYRYGLKYYCLFCLPLGTMSLLYLTTVTTYINAFQIFSFLVLILCLYNATPLRKSALIKSLYFLTPFLIALLYNYFFFTPIDVWSINTEASNRIVNVKNLTLTNLTQLIYVVFGIIVYILFSSIQLDYKKVKRVIEMSMIFVACVGFLQIAAFYLDLNDEFRYLFSNSKNNMADQVFGSWGMKRISSTFPESSYFGQYCFYTLTFYLHQFGYSNFLKSKAVILLIITAAISTSTTAYVGLGLLTFIMYFWYSNPEEKMRYYVAFIILSPLVLYFTADTAIEYWSAKESSNNLRMRVSWDMAWSDIFKSPLFGYAFGTSKPTFIYTQFLHAIGFIGTAIFVIGLLEGNRGNTALKIYLLGVLVLGIANFELARPEIWVYMGLLSNHSLFRQTRQSIQAQNLGLRHYQHASHAHFSSYNK